MNADPLRGSRETDGGHKKHVPAHHAPNMPVQALAALDGHNTTDHFDSHLAWQVSSVSPMYGIVTCTVHRHEGATKTHSPAAEAS